MKIGCCVNMVSEDSRKIGASRIPLLDELGYDYVELPLAQLMELDEAELAELCSLLETLTIPCESCNNFFPASVRITGPEADMDKILDYARTAIPLAAGLGAKTIVFGSSGAKNVPEGFSKEAAFGQVTAALQAIAPILAEYGVTAAIEPICHLEGNLILNEAEAIRLMQAVDRPQVKLLADYYHMSVEGENPAILRQAGADLRHVHIAVPEGRVWPTGSHAGLKRFFEELKNSGYNGRVSIEAYSADFEADAPKALENLRRNYL